MSKLIRIGNRIINLDAIASAEYFEKPDVKVKMLRITVLSASVPAEFKGDEADILWKCLKASAMAIQSQ